MVEDLDDLFMFDGRLVVLRSCPFLNNEGVTHIVVRLGKSDSNLSDEEIFLGEEIMAALPH